MIQAIIFDCFGVLTTDLWKEFLAELEPVQREEARSLMYEHDSGRISEEELSQELKNLTSQRAKRVEAAISIDDNTKNTELLSYVEKLSSDYKIGLLSNIGSNWIQEAFLSEKEQSIFDVMIFSHNVGMVKPDQRIFELTASKLGVDFENCVFIDDSSTNCAVARQLGMQAIVYEDFVQMKQQLEAILK